MKNKMANKKISPHQFKILVFFCYLGSSILAMPGGLAAISYQDSWIAALLGVILGLILVWMYNSLGNKMGNMNLVEYSEKMLGKWIGRLISLSVILFLLLDSSTLVYISGNFISTKMMIETPIEIINLIFVITIIIGILYGLEVYAKVAEILFPGIIIAFIILALFLINSAEFHNLQPFFEYGIKPNLKGMLLYASFTSMMLIPLMMIFPAHVNNIKEAKKSFLTGALMGGITLFIIILLCILVLGANSTARNTYPTYKLSQKINIGNVLNRLESLISILWFILIFFKSILYFHGTLFGLAHFFNLKKHKPLTVPLGMIIFTLSTVLYPNSVYASKADNTTWLSIALTFGVFVPLSLLIINKLKTSFIVNKSKNNLDNL